MALDQWQLSVAGRVAVTGDMAGGSVAGGMTGGTVAVAGVMEAGGRCEQGQVDQWHWISGSYQWQGEWQ